MSDLLSRIDAATAGVCPRGAEPRAGSIYCGPDCEPTHMAEDTDPRMSGELATAMRWRPDLVTAAPDDGLTPMCGPIRLGRFTRHIYRREGTSLIHLRLDDGHRWVGADVEESQGEEYAALCHEKWKALERELGNTRHLVDEDDPWADVMRAVVSCGTATIVVRPSDHNPIVRAVGQPTSATVQTQIRAINDRIAAAVMPSALTVEAFMREAGFALTEWQRSMVEQMYRSTQVVAPQIARRQAQWSDAWVTAMSAVCQLPAEHVEVAGYRPAADPDEPPTDPMQRALWFRRNRNTGPAPDRLDGRRRRRR